jgi:antitoxin (DNA-binding transcriptional repressor) of toxin-antitoxin stability system
MKTATIHELHANPAELVGWIEAGEEIAISNRGKIIARVVPEPEKPVAIGTVDWTTSAALTRDRSGERILSAEESRNLIHEAQGNW